MTETPRRTLASFLRRPENGRKTEDANAPDQDDAAGPVRPAEPTSVPPAGGVPAQGTPPVSAETHDEPLPASRAGSSADDSARPTVAATAAAPGLVPPTAADAAAAGDDRADDARATAPAAPTDWQAGALPVMGAAAVAAPNFARPRTRTPSPRAPLWQWLVLAALAVLLAVQILIADRARLAADARWRPVVETLCRASGCTLPPWHEPTAFTMLDRDVRPVAQATGQLRVQASFRNDARWSQAWPWLQLSLSDADGRVIGTRVFAPAEYLGHEPEAPGLLTAGQSARIDFRVREPAAGTAAFSFEFR